MNYTERLLKESSLEQMWTAVKLNDGKTTGYGLGWSAFDLRGHKVVGHGGGRNNWILRFVDDKLTVIVLCNLFRADALSLVAGVADFYIPSLKQEKNKSK